MVEKDQSQPSSPQPDRIADESSVPRKVPDFLHGMEEVIAVLLETEGETPVTKQAVSALRRERDRFYDSSLESVNAPAASTAAVNSGEGDRLVLSYPTRIALHGLANNLRAPASSSSVVVKRASVADVLDEFVMDYSPPSEVSVPQGAFRQLPRVTQGDFLRRLDENERLEFMEQMQRGKHLNGPIAIKFRAFAKRIKRKEATP